jgi:hypothetical protein
VPHTHALLHSSVAEFKIFGAPTHAHIFVKPAEALKSIACNGKLAAGATNPRACLLAGILLNPALQVPLKLRSACQRLKHVRRFKGLR